MFGLNHNLVDESRKVGRVVLECRKRERVGAVPRRSEHRKQCHFVFCCDAQRTAQAASRVEGGRCGLRKKAESTEVEYRKDVRSIVKVGGEDRRVHEQRDGPGGRGYSVQVRCHVNPRRRKADALERVKRQ